MIQDKNDAIFTLPRWRWKRAALLWIFDEAGKLHFQVDGEDVRFTETKMTPLEEANAIIAEHEAEIATLKKQLAVGTNYVADRDSWPTEVWFENGCHVAIRYGAMVSQIEGIRGYLVVDRKPKQ